MKKFQAISKETENSLAYFRVIGKREVMNKSTLNSLVLMKIRHEYF